jgi:hypothetical protein
MAHDDKDRLADLLGQMAEGGHAENPAHPPAAPVPKGPPSGMPRPQPALPAQQRPVVPKAQAPASPSRPLPPQPVPPGRIAPGIAESAAPPTAPSEGAIAQEVSEPVDDDDAVIVPAPTASAFAHGGAHRPHHPRPQGLSLNVKRTMIPLLLTLSFEMFALIALGAFSPDGSTFKLFFQPGIAITLAILGFLFLPAGLFLMLQVRNEMSQRQSA